MEIKDLQNAVRGPENIVLVDFYATWCGPCKMLANQLMDVEAEGVKVIKIDGEAFPETRDNLGVMSYPTVFLFKDGVVADRFNGFLPAGAILEKVGNL